MRWQDGREGGVEDRRGIGPQHVVGGGGIAVVIVALIGYFFFHIDPSKILGAADQVQGPAAQAGQMDGTPGSKCPEGDEPCKFSATIHASVDDTWAEIFKAEGKDYRPSTLTLYAEDTQTGCGDGQAAMGPFYCPEDERVYLDLDFFNTMEQQLGAKGDFARAYVIAHEVGHHVQNLLGVSAAVERQEQGLSRTRANALSVKLELQADCYAGVWAKRSNDEKHWLEAGDADEALNAAASVGDDTLQKETQGRVVPDSFTHGTSAQRMHWFQAGFTTGDPNQCDTFGSSLG